MPTELILIRHGEVDTNLFRKVIGYKDPPLNKKGYLSAERAARYLQFEGNISAIYSSPLQRAQNTANIIASLIGLTTVIEISLREWDYQRNIRVFDRFLYLCTYQLSQIPSYYLWALKARARNSSLHSFEQDVSNVVEKITFTHPDKKIVIVSHWGTINAILTYFFPNPETWRHGSIRNCSITKLNLDNGRVRLKTFNNVQHLL